VSLDEAQRDGRPARVALELPLHQCVVRSGNDEPPLSGGFRWRAWATGHATLAFAADPVFARSR
jgi:hypothetical protein